MSATGVDVVERLRGCFRVGVASWDLMQEYTGIIQDIYRNYAGTMQELCRNYAGTIQELYRNYTEITYRFC